MTKKDKIQLAVIWGLAIVCWTAAFVAYEIYTSTPASAASIEQPSNYYVNDKYDGDCDPTATDGRCADKCPAGSYEIGIEKETGQAICKLEPTGCPYGDSIPLDSPKCAPPADPATAYAPWNPNDTSSSTSTPQSTSATPKTTNNASFGGAGASGSTEPTEQSQPIVENELEPVVETKNQHETPKQPEKSTSNAAQTVAGSSIIVTILGVIGAVVKRRFF